MGIAIGGDLCLAVFRSAGHEEGKGMGGCGLGEDQIDACAVVASIGGLRSIVYIVDRPPCFC